MSKLLLGFIGWYQRWLRGILPVQCRFVPTCSEYAAQAISRFGVARGGLKAMKRLLLCHPFSRKAGYDPLI